MFIETECGTEIEIKDCSGKEIDPSFKPVLEAEGARVRYFYRDGSIGQATQEGDGNFYIEKTCILNRKKPAASTNKFSNEYSKARRLAKTGKKSS